MPTLPEIFSKAVNLNKLSLVDADIDLQLTYNETQQLINKLSEQLLSYVDLQPGSCVSLVAPNTLNFALSFLATTSLRCISAPLNPKFTGDEFEFYLPDSEAKLILLDSSLLKASANLPIVSVAKKLNIPLLVVNLKSKSEVQLYPLDNNVQRRNVSGGSVKRTVLESDPALLLHTSGTTGRPKAVPLSHGNLTRTMLNIVNTYKLSPNDTTYLVMPLFHVHGLIGGFLSTLWSSGTVIIPSKFSASQFWNQFIKYKCSWYTAVPTIHQVLLLHPKPTEKVNIRFIRSCSSSLAPITMQKLEEAFNAPVLEAYAMTEAAHQMTSNPLPPLKHKPGSVGIPQGLDIKILDAEGNEVEEGEVCIKGINVTKGYVNNPKANAESFTSKGYFRTGDQGKFDSEGYLFLTGRIKELINRGGEKISPLEVDNVLLRFPAVQEAVTFAVPDQKYGQEVHAVIKLKEGAVYKEEELLKFCKSKLVDFKIPKKVYVTDTLPKTATGKIQRRKMVDHFFKPKDVKAKL